MNTIKIICSAATFVFAESTLAGVTVQPAATTPEITASTSDGWMFTAGLYGWGAGLEGDTGFAGFTAPLDVSFSDILSSLDMTAMGMVELKKGPWMFQLEGLYLKNSLKSRSFSIAGGGPFRAKFEAKTTRLQPMIGYRVMDNETTQIDLLAGAVYYDISNELSFLGVGASPGVQGGDDWFDPIVGVRLTHSLNEKFSLRARGDVGGFGVNADIVWQLVGLVGYDLSESSTMFVGWRHAAVDYQNGGFTYDVANSGPIIGASFSW